MEGGFCKLLMEVPFLQEVVLVLIITYIYHNKQPFVLTGGYCVPGRGENSLDQECLFKPCSDWRQAGIGP